MGVKTETQFISTIQNGCLDLNTVHACLDDSDDHLRWLAATDLNLDYMGNTHLHWVTLVHDALEDVRALRKILFESSLSLSRKDIVENSSITSLSHAVQKILHLHRRHELLLTFSDKLHNTSDTGPIKRSMALNIADSGLLSYDDIHKLYTTFGKRALVAILSNPPTFSSAKTPRVTRRKRILTAIVKHFNEINHEE